MKALLGVGAAVLLGAATPAVAVQRFNVALFGELVPSAGANTIAGLPFGAGSSLTASWDIDITQATPTGLAPINGTGSSAVFSGAVSNGFLGLASGSAVLIFFQNGTSLGNIFAVDNATNPAPPIPGGMPSRSDQVTISDNVSYGAFGPSLTYTAIQIGGDIPANVFLSNLAFGRSVVGPTDPMLIDNTVTIDPFSLWQFGIGIGPQPVFSLTLRQGFATTPQEASALPSTRFTLRTPAVFLTEISVVPEPGSWMMLIAGFGLVGAALRRRQVAAAL